VANALSDEMDNFEGHWQPVWSAILATAGLLVLLDLRKLQLRITTRRGNQWQQRHHDYYAVVIILR